MTIRTPKGPGSPGSTVSAGSPGVLSAPEAARAPIDSPKTVAIELESWFLAAARDLPWRRARTGYAALVSELMLQQTQVQRVVPAFEQFMARFPTIERLAAAGEQEVLAAWQGLGYYRRARLLHAAARAIVAEHGGKVPQTAAALGELPGVGRYTAGAVASIAFGAREPIVDGNVFRVLARLAASASPADDRAALAWAWQQAERLVKAAPNPGATNEALMELGATVCTPAAPRCAQCPLAGRCVARRLGDPEAYPAPKRAASKRDLHWHTIVCASDRGVFLQQREGRGLWARMWQTPTVESDVPLVGQRAKHALAAWGVATRKAGTFAHVTTHRRVKFTVHVPDVVASGAARGGAARGGAARATCATCAAGAAGAAGAQAARALGEGEWVPLADLAKFPLANAMWRVLQVAGIAVTPPPSAGACHRADLAGRVDRRAARAVATGS